MRPVVWGVLSTARIGWEKVIPAMRKSPWCDVRAIASRSLEAAQATAAKDFFAQKGFGDATMRDIAGAAGMLPGSLYYHFASKEDLLVAVYAEGVRRIKAAVEPALKSSDDPWQRLENVCAAHLDGLLEDSDYGQVVIRVRPDDVPQVARRLTALRDEYEQTFARALSGLSLPPRTDRRALRLMLLGALNWSQTWYRPGKDSPQVLARRFVRLLREPLDP